MDSRVKSEDISKKEKKSTFRIWHSQVRVICDVIGITNISGMFMNDTSVYSKLDEEYVGTSEKYVANLAREGCSMRHCLSASFGCVK
jgi:hypothetical protein